MKKKKEEEEEGEEGQRKGRGRKRRRIRRKPSGKESYGGASGKEPPAVAGDLRDSGLIPGEGNDNPLQYSCLGNPTDKGAWQVHGVTCC